MDKNETRETVDGGKPQCGQMHGKEYRRHHGQTGQDKGKEGTEKDSEREKRTYSRCQKEGEGADPKGNCDHRGKNVFGRHAEWYGGRDVVVHKKRNADNGDGVKNQKAMDHPEDGNCDRNCGRICFLMQHGLSKVPGIEKKASVESHRGGRENCGDFRQLPFLILSHNVNYVNFCIGKEKSRKEKSLAAQCISNIIGDRCLPAQ